MLPDFIFQNPERLQLKRRGSPAKSGLEPAKGGRKFTSKDRKQAGKGKKRPENLFCLEKETKEKFKKKHAYKK